MSGSHVTQYNSVSIRHAQKVAKSLQKSIVSHDKIHVNHQPGKQLSGINKGGMAKHIAF